MKLLNQHKGTTGLLSVLALAAAIQFSPSRLAAEMGLRPDSRPDSRQDSSIGSPAAPSQIGRAPSAPAWEGRRETLPTGERDAARTAIRQIEADARELYNLNSRAIRNGSREEINALNRVSELQRAAYDLTIMLDRRDCTPEMASRQYSAFMTTYESARNSWRPLYNTQGARDFTVRIERCYSPVTHYFAPPVVYISWNDVRRAADDIEEAAEHLYETALRESRGYGDYRTRESRRVALEQLCVLRDAARDFDSYLARCGNDPARSREKFRRLMFTLESSQYSVRIFGRHAQRDFDELDALMHEIEPFYVVRRGHDHGNHDHDDHDHGNHYGGSSGSSWNRGSGIGSPRVIGSVR